MKNQNLKSLSCPSCHAPLKADGSERMIQCTYCHSSVEVPQTDKTTVVVVTREADSAQPAWQRAYQSNMAKYSWVPIVVIVVISMIMGMTSHFRTRNTAGVAGLGNQPKFVSFYRQVLQLPKTEQVDAQVFFMVQSLEGVSSQNAYQLVAANANTMQTLWKGPSLESTTVQSHMTWIGDEKYVYLAAKTRLMWIDRKTGETTESSLQDELPTGARTTLIAFPDQVVALSKDGSLQGFSKKEGRRLWTTRLNTTPDHIFSIADKVGVLDEQKNKRGFVLFQPDSGKEAGRVMPAGPNWTFRSDPQTLSFPASSNIVLDPDGHSVYFLFGYYAPYSIQRWDMATQEKKWATAVDLEDSIISSLPYAPLQTDKYVIFGSEKKGVVVDKTTGAVIFSIREKESSYKLRALGIVDGTLLMDALRTRGTTRHEIWGFDLTSGDRLWQSIIDSEFEFKGKAGISQNWFAVNGPVSFWGLSDKGLCLLLVDPNKKSFTMETLDPKTGVGQGEKSIAWPWQSNPAIIEWKNNKAWRSTYHKLERIDVTSWKTEATWPKP